MTAQAPHAQFELHSLGCEEYPKCVVRMQVEGVSPVDCVVSVRLMQKSVLVLLLETNVFTNPSGQASHIGCAVVVPAIFVNIPAGQLLWAVHHSKAQPVVTKKNRW